MGKLSLQKLLQYSNLWINAPIIKDTNRNKIEII